MVPVGRIETLDKEVCLRQEEQQKLVQVIVL